MKTKKKAKKKRGKKGSSPFRRRKYRKSPKRAKTPVRTLAPSDPLQIYLSKIARFSLLSPEEEKLLTKRYFKSKDPKAAYELTVRNLRLVVKIAMEYRRAWSNVLDLIQEGNIGLMTAIQRFDPYRQTKLSTYASWWIRAYILKFIMSNWRLIKIGNTQAERKLFYNLRKEQERLLSEGFVPGPKLLAERLDVKESDVIEMSKRLGSSELSLDRPHNYQKSGGDDREGPTLGDAIPLEAVSVDEALAKDQLKNLVHEATEEFRKQLKRREILLLEKRILSDEPVTLQEIGDEWGVSRERVRQIEARLMDKFKTFFAQKYPDIKSSLS